MDSMINIGAKLDKVTTENLAAAIVKVLECASKVRTDEQTTRAALDVLKQVATTSNVQISGCQLKAED